MPFFVRQNGKVVDTETHDGDDNLHCTECNASMSVVASFPRNGTFVSKHFRHPSGGTGSSGCGGGESDRHREMKLIALHKLQHQFDHAVASTEQKIGDNIADVYLRFDEPHDDYGYGFAVEVQYKNKGKDIEAANDNYLNHGYTPVWVWEDQFDGKDVDLLSGTVLPVWPHAVPDDANWSRPTCYPTKLNDHSGLKHEEAKFALKYNGFNQPKTNVKLPKAYYDLREWTQWNQSEWSSRFRGTHDFAPDASEYTVQSEVPFGKWLPNSDKYRKQLYESYSKHVKDADTPGTDRQKMFNSNEVHVKSRNEISKRRKNNRRARESAKRIMRIIEYNTGNNQPEDIAIHTIKQIASHSNIGHVGSAVDYCVDLGKLQETDDDRYRLVR